VGRRGGARVEIYASGKKKARKGMKIVEQGGVSHRGPTIYIKKYLKAKEESWKFKYFTMQKYNLQKKNPKSFKRS
jgi:hypothetical protein